LDTYLTERRAGVLLHPTSLPDTPGQGNPAYRFIDFLQAAGFTVWQTLPLGPTHADHSPYQCLSVHAGNAALICLDELVERGWLAAASRSAGSRQECLVEAHNGFKKVAQAIDIESYQEFKQQHDYWLQDYSLYQAIRQVQLFTPWRQAGAGLE